MQTATVTAIRTCPFCAEEIRVEAKKCKHCGEMLDASLRAQKKFNPGAAAVLSFFIPGAGQIYKGEIGQGLFWLFSVIFGYMFFVVPGIVLHIMCIMNAYGNSQAKKPQSAKPTVPKIQNERLFGARKWQEYMLLFMPGFVPLFFIGLAKISDSETIVPAAALPVLFVLTFALPAMWFLLRPHALARGWIREDPKKSA